MQKEKKMREKDVEVKENITYKTVFIHLNMKYIMQIFAFSY